MPDTDAQPCARCTLPRREHHHSGAAYGVCGEFIEKSADTHDLDALIREASTAIERYRQSRPGTVGRDVATNALTAATEALRARLAPTTHADDEALVETHATAHRRYMVDMCNNREQQYATFSEEVVPSDAALKRRLSELRARAETQERIANDFGNAMQGWCDKAAEQQTRAEAAEVALAECRAVFERMDALNITKEEYIAQGPGRALKALREIATMIRALKKQESRNG